MEYKKLGILGICSSLSLGLCDNVDAARRATNAWRASDAGRVHAIQVAAQQGVSPVLDGIRAATNVHDLVAVQNANLNAGVTQDATALNGMRTAQNLQDLVAVQNANLNAGVTQDATALDGMRNAQNLQALVAVQNANLNAGVTQDATALNGMRAAENLPALVKVPNANFDAAFNAKIPFLMALYGDSLAGLADDAWASSAFGGGKLNNDDLARILKPAYGRFVHATNGLNGLDACIGVAGTHLSDVNDAAQTFADCHSCTGTVDETLADLRAVGGTLNQGGKDHLAPVFDRLIRRLLVLSVQ